jgi:NAD(P)-dependent dehydrogenase (short-subunit alcohol dehydrogenase family)
MSLEGKHILITGAARRIGRLLALAVAHAGGTVIIHHAHSSDEAIEVQQTILAMGKQAYILQADLGDPSQVTRIVDEAASYGPLFALVTCTSLKRTIGYDRSSSVIDTWMLICPVPSQAFARSRAGTSERRIVNILDWRALRPGATTCHTVGSCFSGAHPLVAAHWRRVHKRSGSALSYRLPRSQPERIIEPVLRWAEPDEVGQALIFL